MRYFFLILISATFLFSCQKALEIDYPDIEPKLVVNCLFTTDSLFKLQLSRTSSYNDTLIVYVTDAKCEIWKNNSVSDILQYSDSGFYTGSTKPDENVIYTLKISHSKYGNVQAKSSCPEKAIIDTVYDKMNVYPVEGDINMDNLMYSALYIDFEDKLVIPQYYFINLKYRYSSVYYPEKWGYRYLTSYDEIIKKEQILEYEPEFLVFSNNLFTNPTINLEVLFIHNVGSGKKNMNNNKGNNYPHQTLYKFGTISEDYYLYLKSLIKHKYNQFNDVFLQMGDPVQMYTNIENGYGIFAGYNYDTGIITDSIGATND